MNTKTLISALALTLALGSLALPGTAAARDYDRGGDRQEHRRDRHDNDRGRHERRDRDRHDHRRHDNGHHYGHNRYHSYPYVQYRHHRHWNNGYFLMDPLPIIRIEPRW